MYKVGEKVRFGAYDWLVLDIKEEKALLLTESMVCQKPFNNKTGPVTWADSSIRVYLNNDFYSEFSDEDRLRIVPVLNKNQGNLWYGSDGGEDTFDHVFLLSIEEAVCMYFGDSSYNLFNKSDKQRYWFQKKDKNNINRQADYQEYSWWYWLRSPGRDNKRAVYIHGDGNIGIQGNGTYKYSSKTIHPITKDNCGGVRPAIWVNIEKSS